MSPRKAYTVVEAKPMMLLPPAKDKCQECARAHKPEEPHDATSLFYGVKLKMETGREPTWSEAMAHCTPEVREGWTATLKEKFGVDINSTKVWGNAR